MEILITSGGTREYIDGVRVLTNISSGKLGAMIADTIISHSNTEIEINFVYVKGSELPKSDGFIRIGKSENKFPYNFNCLKLHEVTDVESVYNVMEKLVPEMDVVIHPMAVSDFGFRPIHTKLKSNDPEAFIESLRERIYQTPKILAHIKEWNPKCYLVSFKFEDGVEHDELIKIAADSFIKNHCDLVIANEKSEMVNAKEHIAYAFDGSKNLKKLTGKSEIAMEILNRVLSFS